MFYSYLIPTDLLETIYIYDAGWILISDLVKYN